MARRVFLSFLGTNNYVSTRYRLGNYTSSPVRFVQQALIEALCPNWTAEDAVIIIYTMKAFEKNWKDNGHDNAQTDEERRGLNTTLKAMNFKMQILDQCIPEEFTEADIWDIFDTVYDSLQEGDQIYLDVTHAFRLIPLFTIPLFNYAHFMKHTDLRAIYYGAFEQLGSKEEVLAMDATRRVAPIVDLTSLVGLQMTNVAASNLMEFGKVGSIAAHEAAPGQKESSYTAMAIQTVKQELQKLDEYIETCNMEAIRRGDYVKKIEKNFSQVMASKSLTPPEQTLLAKIKEFLKEFSPKETDDNIIAAVHWAAKYKKVQPVYTLGREFIVSKMGVLVNQLKIARDVQFEFSQERVFREFLGDLIGNNNPKAEYCSKHIREEFDRNAINEFGRSLWEEPWMKDLKRDYQAIAKNRNDLNHAQAYTSIEDLMQTFEEKFNKCLTVINAQLV